MHSSRPCALKLGVFHCFLVRGTRDFPTRKFRSVSGPSRKLPAIVIEGLWREVWFLRRGFFPEVKVSHAISSTQSL